MPQAKRYRFSYEDQELARMGRIIGHPARIVILEQLKSSGPLSFSHFRATVPLHYKTVSGHIQELIKEEMIEVCELEGGISGYRLISDSLELLTGTLRQFIEDRLGEVRSS